MNIVNNVINDTVRNNKNISYVICTDVRFKHEFDFIRKNHGILINVLRNDVDQLENIAEHDLDYIDDDFDFTIDNSGTYDDLFIGDYWTINGVNWRIVAIDYYYNIGDTNFDKGNIIVMPDTVLYNAQMNETNTTAGAYAGSLMRTQNLNNARTIVRNAFGSHLANHRILLANSVDTSGPNNWSWYDSDGVELPNEVQIYGTRVWGSALKGFDVATQKQQFPLMLLAPQFVNTRQNYWLQDVSSGSVSGGFAFVNSGGYAGSPYASYSLGVRPSVTLSYI